MHYTRPRFESIPECLKRRKQWVLWKEVRSKNGKKPRKIPLNARTGKAADTTDPRTWSTYEQAVAAYEANPKKYRGIGYVFAKDDPYVGIDIDNCIEGNEPSQLAQNIVSQFGTYAEISPSQTGIKLFCKGKLYPLKR